MISCKTFYEIENNYSRIFYKSIQELFYIFDHIRKRHSKKYTITLISKDVIYNLENAKKQLELIFYFSQTCKNMHQNARCFFINLRIGIRNKIKIFFITRFFSENKTDKKNFDEMYSLIFNEQINPVHFPDIFSKYVFDIFHYNWGIKILFYFYL